MKNIMFFKDRNSSEFGAVVVALPSIPSAARRGDWEAIAGTDGAQWMGDGTLESTDVAVNLWLPPETDIDEAAAWLSGSGNLRFNDFPWFWKAWRSAAFALTPCAFDDGWEASVKFHIQPHRYRFPEAEALPCVGGEMLVNPCTAEAQPLIEVTGLGDVNLMVGRYTVLLHDLDGTVLLDCEAKEAFSGDFDAPNGQIEPVDGWPRLVPGNNAVSWTGTAEVKITPRWRSI